MYKLILVAIFYILLSGCNTTDNHDTKTKDNRTTKTKDNGTTENKSNPPIKVYVSVMKGLDRTVADRIIRELQKQCPNITFEQNDNSIQNHLRIEYADHDLDEKSTNYLEDLMKKSTLKRMVIFVFFDFNQAIWDKLKAKYGSQLKLVYVKTRDIENPRAIKGIISLLDLCK